MGKVVFRYNDLLTQNPKLAAQWHPTKNGELTPDHVAVHSGKKFWWLGKCNHEWQATVLNRNKGSGCPYCSGKRVLKGFNDLATRNPELASEWHPTKNNGLSPTAVTASSGKKVWWQCPNGHEWQATIADRNDGHGCPYCSGKRVLKGYNDLATKNPELAKEWHPVKNGDLTPDTVTAGSREKVWWQCSKGHEWQAVISSRSKGISCPYCSRKKAIKCFNDLNTINPELASEWHPTKNGGLTPDMVMPGSGKKVWWQCSKKHEWQATIKNRSKGNGCPYCSGSRTLKGFNDLATMNPVLASEWHPTKNNGLTPDMVTAHSGKKVWWLCKCGHEWQARIADRSKGHGCPRCGRKMKTQFRNKCAKH